MSDLEKKKAVQNSDFNMSGTITKVQLPDVRGSINQIYKNSIFLDNIKEFQTNLLLKESKHIQYAIQTMDYEKMILNINY